MNRSTIFEFLRNDTELELRYSKIGKGNYPVLRIPYDWEESYLIINNTRFTSFQAVMLFSKELVVRFSPYTDDQVNIPYKDIDYIEVRDDLYIGYRALHNGDKVKCR